MRFQHQTTFGGPDAPEEHVGNCYAACIASLLGVALERVPNFCRFEDYFGRTQRWLSDRGMLLLHFPKNPIGGIPEWEDRGILIAAGKSPRGPFDHAVLWRGGKLLHDPHPSGAGIVGDPTGYEILVVADPDGFRRWLTDGS